MTLNSFLYLTQLEEYEISRIKTWLKNHPHTEVSEIKKHLIWTVKIKVLALVAKILFFLPPEKSVIFGLYLLTPFDFILKNLIVFLAFLKLKIFHRQLLVIGITGSWGKTTSKDTLLDLIGSKFIAFATTGNHNTLLGVSLDILKLPLNTQYFIAEIGAYYPNDIAKVCRIIRPKYAIVTAIGPMHLERFKTLDKILDTKMELPQSVGKNGWIYLPVDIKQKIFHIKLNSKNILFFKTINDVYQHLCRLLDIDSTTFKNILQNHQVSEHRLQIIKNGTITIVDDTYNSNPAGFKLALDTLKNLKSNNNILITPGMIELGTMQEKENSRLIKLADALCEHLVLVGHTNRDAFKSALKNSKSNVYYVDTIADAQTLLSSITSPTAAILFENDLPDNYL